jgi:predicted nuclease with TOPRIM domain
VNDLLHWLPAILPTLVMAAAWGSTSVRLARVQEDLREAKEEARELREENKRSREELQSENKKLREELHAVREIVVRLDERSQPREPTGRHPSAR